jgi:hypothetical protein
MAVPAVVAVVVPLALVAALPLLRSHHTAAEVKATGEFVPLDRGPRATARLAAGSVTLSWNAVKTSTTPTYTVYRTPVPVHCSDRRGATRCVFELTRLATTHATTFSERPPKGLFGYRVALTANYVKNLLPRSTILVGPPVTVRNR